jgi:hypothetical protein
MNKQEQQYLDIIKKFVESCQVLVDSYQPIIELCDITDSAQFEDILYDSLYEHREILIFLLERRKKMQEYMNFSAPAKLKVNIIINKDGRVIDDLDTVLDNTIPIPKRYAPKKINLGCNVARSIEDMDHYSGDL